MAPGTGTFKGLAVPIFGEFEQIGATTANDQVTWTQKGGASGDMMVWRSSAGTEYLLIDASGSLILKDSNALEFGSLGNAAGDMVLQFDGTSLVLSASTHGTRFDLGTTTSATTIDVRFLAAASGATGGYVQWDSSSQRLLFNQSSVVDSAKLNLTGGTHALSTPPVQNLAPGDLFIVDALGVTTMRLGVCTTGNSVRYGASFSKAITSAS